MTMQPGATHRRAARRAPALPQTRRRAIIATWLFTVAGLIWVLAMVGAATRLTESGLSITEWAPVTGAVPPMSAQAWEEAFTAYRQTDEYRLEAISMTMAEFQTIYWWEWGHRQLGRFIGLAYGVPLLVFLSLGWIRRGMRLPLVGLLALGGLQGAVGWIMVASGLEDGMTDVSPYKLAMHLGLAAVLFGAVMWHGFAVLEERSKPPERPVRIPAGFATAAIAVLAFIYAQLLSGAFVAGTNAGMTYTTWPLMDGRLVPPGYLELSPVWRNVFENLGAVQFNHRMMAYALVLFGGAVSLWGVLRTHGALRLWCMALLAGLSLQTLMGIATLLTAVAIPLGVAHQGGAFILIAVGIAVAHKSLVARRALSLGQAEA